MKIYTKQGDAGQTRLIGGTQVSKDDVRLEAYGTIDELNAQIGLLISVIDTDSDIRFLSNVQHELFTIGSMLAKEKETNFEIPTIGETSIDTIEEEIDELNASLPPLKNFILPSGSEAIAIAHICRTITRRSERRVVTLDSIASISPLIIKYLNRLSDYFFVLSRSITHEQKVSEVIWEPKTK